jgi:putative hydrolase of the HAD superfamily
MRHHGVMAGTIRAVLFDADGVVQTSNPVVDVIGSLCGCDASQAEAFLHELWRREEELGCLVGGGDLLGGVAVMLSDRGVTHEPSAFYADLLRATIVPAHHVLALVDQLRAAGVFCALATNQERNRLAFMTEALGYAGRFDRIYGSCALGLRKPTAEYFEAIVRDVGLPADEMLFLDDHEPNVDSARAVGMRAELVASVDDVAGHLATHGVLA